VYQKVIDWSEDAEIRRTFESKLLRHTWETLLVCSPEEKDMRRDKVWRVAHGMVVLNLPDELAWTICVDWRDFEMIGSQKSYKRANISEMYGVLFLQDLIRAIPQSGLAKVLSAYLKSDLSRFPSEEPEDEDEESGVKMRPAVPIEDILDEMIVHPHII
jgi:superkiller protein 3